MPIFKNRTTLKIARNIEMFLNLEAGIRRLHPPQPEAPSSQDQKFEHIQRLVVEQRREITRLKAELAATGASADSARVRAASIVWTFGSGRTGSTWLSAMLRAPKDHIAWGEPLVGKLFADLYYSRVGDLHRDNGHFVLGNPYKEAWLKSIRSFVLDGASARFPEVAERGFLMISEPNGSVGAPLLMEALPESRLIFLIRDPRDVVASFLDAVRQGGWLHAWKGEDSRNEESLADSQPDVFVKQQSNAYLQHVGRTREAYEAHEGHKVLVRYEDLRADTLGTMRRVYSALDIAVDQEELARVVEAHTWEKIPEERKGAKKFYRKAAPGSWRADLTLRQAEIVEEITEPLLKEYYSD